MYHSTIYYLYYGAFKSSLVNYLYTLHIILWWSIKTGKSSTADSL